MSTYREYRVVSKRVGQARKVKTYRGLTQAQRRLLLFGPEPWTAYTDEDPDTYVCCNGSPQSECGCGGLTWRQASDAKRAQMPLVEYARVETRLVTVTKWEPVDDTARVPGDPS